MAAEDFSTMLYDRDPCARVRVLLELWCVC